MDTCGRLGKVEKRDEEKKWPGTRKGVGRVVTHTYDRYKDRSLQDSLRGSASSEGQRRTLGSGGRWVRPERTPEGKWEKTREK